MADDSMAPDLAGMLHQLRRREARRRGGAELTYREIAAKTGWSLGIVAQYFSGKTLPPIDRFDALLRLLGASPAELGTLATARDQADELRRGHRRPASEAGAFRLLGPVNAMGPRGTARLVGVRQRALVSLLALNAGRAVTQDRLVDAIWGEKPPRTAVRTLYTHVARVRQALDSCGLVGVLRTQGAGYLLAIAAEEVDASRFERRVAQARAALNSGAISAAVTHLREGLALWRGDALADTPAQGWGAAEVERLHEVRRCAQEDLWEALLRLGEHAGIVGEIDKLLVSHPGRERSVDLLMLALYRSGRTGEAVEAYQRLRGHLADHLGIEPSARVQRLYTSILRHDTDLDLPGPVAPGPLRPAQLPPRAGHFTGRSKELTVLSGLTGGQPRVGVVSGPAGIGKTALVLQWAHRVTDRYADGQLFVDLRGHDPATALSANEALTTLLAGLGLPAARIPTEPGALAGMYRSALHQRRVLVVLDNAASADQIAALVPPSPTCLLLVTSRHRLTGLAVDHAVSTVELDALLPDDAMTLLRRVLGADRVTGEPAAACQLIELCDRMPLALRIAAAKLTARPRGQIAELVAALSGADMLDALSVPGDSRSVRTVFAGAYHALSDPAATMFRRLGRHPGPTFTAALAATLIEATAVTAQATLDELTSAHLVVDMGMDRYRFHDLIRAYARECAETGEASRSSARIIDWYLTVADIANRVFDPARDRAGPISVSPPIEAPIPADHDTALAFLDAERANLLPVARHASEQGDQLAAWRLTYLLTSFHTLRGHWAEQVELVSLGLAAARSLADPVAEAFMRLGLGLAYNATQRYDEALEHLRVALDLMRAAGDQRGQGMTLSNIALAYVRLGWLDEAMDTFKQALALHTSGGHQPGIALALNNIGHIHTMMGQPDLAMAYLSRGLALTRRIGHRAHEAAILHSLGEAHLAAMDPGSALTQFEAALQIRRRIGERRLEADTLNLMGLAHGRRGDHAAATANFQQALVLSRELDDRHLEAVTLAHLGSLGAGNRDDRDRVDDAPAGHRGDLHREPEVGRSRRRR
jgi:DNA-binding SARP family transcriptional activator/Tfp pilus assembly protein PilF